MNHNSDEEYNKPKHNEDEIIRKLDEDEKIVLLHRLNLQIGNDITELGTVHHIDKQLISKKERLQKSLNLANDEVPTKLSTALEKAEQNSKDIEKLNEKSDKLKKKVERFLNKTEPLRVSINNRFTAIGKLEEVLNYLQSFEKIEDLSTQLKQCNDDEQAVLLYGELKEMCLIYTRGHRANFVKDYTHYWHNVLKDKLTKQYEDILKSLKWPFTTAQEHSPPPKEVLPKFRNTTKHLLLIEEPIASNKSEETSIPYDSVENPCLPIKILLRPLKKRFAFHFTGSRQTARIDRPEWFLTQTLTWIKDHQGFIVQNVQPVADELKMKHVKAEDEFNLGLLALAAERLHTVLSLYTQGQREGSDVDAAFAHAVDETLGFHKELLEVTDLQTDSVLAVLTKAETFERWLAVETKYALSKMDETLSNEQWIEPVIPSAHKTGWVPRGADWFIALLKTIEERYAVLPQPGHRLQFLDLQIDLIEEWRIRLTQLLSAAIATLTEGTFLTADASPHLITAVINTAHHTRTVLMQWMNSLHYLQLHFYKRQFQSFMLQHHDFESSTEQGDPAGAAPLSLQEKRVKENEAEKTISLVEVEVRSQIQALSEMTRRSSSHVIHFDEETSVFEEAPALFELLRETGMAALADHILIEFKAVLRDYKKQKWHAMSIVEEMALSVSPSLCRPLSGITARLHAASAKLAPALSSRLRAEVQSELDNILFEEVVLQSWWNTGGTMQLTHDVKRNIEPAIASPNKDTPTKELLPKLNEAITLLNMDYDDARRQRASLSKQVKSGADTESRVGKLTPTEALRLLNQRTDLGDNSPPSVLELF